MSRGRALRGLVLGVVGLGLIAPIALGLGQSLQAAFGILPALDLRVWSLEPWRMLLAQPGFGSSLQLSLLTGLGSTLIALVLALGFCAAGSFGRGPGRLRWLAPFLAVPHAAMAVGLAFVLAPSGWIARGLALAFGWNRPPDIASVHDAWGLALMLGLVVKELPFLLLVIASGLAQLPVARQIAAGRALGYGPGVAWIKLILPQLWPLIRLPVWVVLAYGLSVVDMAIILGPSNPPSLAVAVVRLFSQPDLAMILPASAGAMLQAALVVVCIAALWGAEAALRLLGRWWVPRGGRGMSWAPGLRLASGAVWALMALASLALVSLLLWSLAWRWSFPLIWPESWSAAAWASPSATWGAALYNTVILAAASTAVSLALAVLWLEAEADLPRAPWAEALIYLPLLMPQIGFLYGLNVWFLRAGLSGGYLAVIWAQALLVFPYVMITLSEPWRSVDPRLLRVAAALGAGRWRRLLGLRLPILLRPILTAAAIGVAVSVAQYLPTLFMGAGRIATLTTEAVTLASGADRRVVGVYASLQAALPFAAYAAAALLPMWWHRNRRDLRGGGV
ncbi:ABC transporter permease [Cypionkella aquatica]|uniref:ABC transporter permease n=1 Tax=Cypionkella aquatica TaxID=1756042 RepID=A0AA37X039_9RHOB|nr:ABC transporter permease subunit [Cypionkella aquatica]GLS86912.1 ABC transporter permease [Cypionkella aquatica]